MEHSSDAFWSTYARSYDRVLPVMPFYRDAIQRHIAAILACGARRVLDVGCGTGNVAIPLAIAGARVIALDKSDAMLERLRDKAIAHSVEGEVEIVVNNAEEAQFPTPVDAVNCLLALFCMTDGVAVLGKMIKSLRPGGIVVLTEPTRRFSEELLLEYGREVLFDRMQRVDLADDWDVVRNAGKALGGLIRQSEERTVRSEDLPERLASLGCTIVAIRESHLGQCRHIVACRTTG